MFAVPSSTLTPLLHSLLLETPHLAKRSCVSNTNCFSWIFVTVQGRKSWFKLTISVWDLLWWGRTERNACMPAWYSAFSPPACSRTLSRASKLYFQLGFPTSIMALKTVPRPESHAASVSLPMMLPGLPGSRGPRDLEQNQTQLKRGRESR